MCTFGRPGNLTSNHADRQFSPDSRTPLTSLPLSDPPILRRQQRAVPALLLNGRVRRGAGRRLPPACRETSPFVSDVCAGLVAVERKDTLHMLRGPGLSRHVFRGNYGMSRFASWWTLPVILCPHKEACCQVSSRRLPPTPLNFVVGF